MIAQSPNRWRVGILRLGAGLLILALGLFVLGSRTTLIHRAVRTQLAERLAAHGIGLRVTEMRGGLAEPLRLVGVRLRTAAGLEVSIRVADVEVDWWRVVTGKSGGWLRSVACDSVSVRTRDSAGVRPWPEWDPRPWLPSEWMAQRIEVRAPGPAGTKLEIRKGSIWAAEREVGRFHARSIRITEGSRSWQRAGEAGTTAWKDGVLYLAELDLPARLALDELAVDAGALRKRRIGVWFEGRWHQGAIRGDLSLSGRGTNLHLDGTFSGWNLDLSRLHVPNRTPAEGKIRECRLSFRGSTAHPDRADWGVRLVMDHFALGTRRFDALTLGASAHAGSLQLYEFALHQGPNTLTARGEADLPHQPSAWQRLRGSGWIEAALPEIERFAGLLPRRFHHLQGQGTLRAGFSSAEGKLTGRLDATAGPLVIRSVPLETASVSLSLQGNTLELDSASFRHGTDELAMSGSLALLNPHRYRAELRLVADEIGRYERVFPIRGFEGLRGTVDLKWSGDGTLERHSGAFDAALTQLRIPLPSGAVSLPLDARIEATYSPESLFSRRFEIRQGVTRLAATLTATPTSLDLQGLTLSRGATPLLNGTLTLPLDLRELWEGHGLARILDPEGLLTANLSGTGIDLCELLRLTGREWPVRGLASLTLNASGTPSRPSANGTLVASRLVVSPFGTDLPPSNLTLGFEMGETLLRLTGNLANTDTRQISLQAALPIRIREAIQTGTGILRPDAPLDLSLAVRDAALAQWAPLLGIDLLEGGTASGSVRISGNAGAPVWSGQIEVANARVALPAGFDPIQRLGGRILLRDTTAEMRGLTGQSGSARITLSGAVSLANPSNPWLSLRFEAPRLRLAPTWFDFSATTSADLFVEGPANSARLHGSIRTLNGEIRTGPAQVWVEGIGSLPASESPASFPGLDLSPLPAGWELDVDLQSTGLKGLGTASGSLVLRGTVASPYLLGSVALQAWPVRFADPPAPVRDGTFTEARWDFESNNPWMPRFTATGLVGNGTDVSGIRIVCEGTRRGFLERETPAPTDSGWSSPSIPTGNIPAALAPMEQVPVFVRFGN